MNPFLSKIVKAGALFFSTTTILMILLGFYGYLFGNLWAFGVRYGTYILFSQYMFYLAATFTMLLIAFKNDK